MRKQSKQDKRIGALYSKHCDGITVPIMSLGDIMKAGEDAIARGASDDEVGAALKAAALAAAVTL